MVSLGFPEGEGKKGDGCLGKGKFSSPSVRCFLSESGKNKEDSAWAHSQQHLEN